MFQEALDEIGLELSLEELLILLNEFDPEVCDIARLKIGPGFTTRSQNYRDQRARYPLSKLVTTRVNFFRLSLSNFLKLR